MRERTAEVTRENRNADEWGGWADSLRVRALLEEGGATVHEIAAELGITRRVAAVAVWRLGKQLTATSRIVSPESGRTVRVYGLSDIGRVALRSHRKRNRRADDV